MQNITENMLTGDHGITEKIKRSMYNVCNEYLTIGYYLNEVKEYEYYMVSGYRDVYDYAFQELGFKKTTVKNFISICKNFCLVDSLGRDMLHLKTDYKNFNYSQLCEMLSLSQPQRAQVSSDMTIKQIREFKVVQNSVADIPFVGQTSDQVLLEHVLQEHTDKLFMDEVRLMDAIQLQFTYADYTVEELGQIYIYMVNLKN